MTEVEAALSVSAVLVEEASTEVEVAEKTGRCLMPSVAVVESRVRCLSGPRETSQFIAATALKKEIQALIPEDLKTGTAPRNPKIWQQ